MDEDDNSFPMDFYVEDPSPRPWKFRPEGYLAVILSDDDDGERAANALVADGFARDDFKLHTGKQILANFEVYSARRNLTDKVTGPVVDDSEGRERYLGYAREAVARCGFACRTKTGWRRPSGRSRTPRTCTHAIGAPRSRPTSSRGAPTHPENAAGRRAPFAPPGGVWLHDMVPPVARRRACYLRGGRPDSITP